MPTLTGLTADEVRQRTLSGQTNRLPDRSSRRVADILRANIFTRFNALLTILAVALLLVGGDLINSLFFGVMIINSGIGIFQELRAKRMLDRLAILAAPRVTVIRDGEEHDIAVKDIVQDDLIKLKLGDQVVVDGKILVSEELEIDESLLTGEADPIAKKTGGQALSGSLVVAGGGIMRADKIGAASYSAQLTQQVKKFQRVRSELMDSINRLLKWISWMLLVVGPILVVGQLRVSDGNLTDAVTHAVAALVGMIPEGLVLLTSAAFMLAAIQLGRRKVLMQQMAAVETLARVDTLLLDKTGTLTEGDIRFEAIVLTDEDVVKRTSQKEKVNHILATIASRATSPTNNAIALALSKVKPSTFSREIAFSSARKWSAIEINKQSFIFGAPEVILAHKSLKTPLAAAQEIAQTGKRVLVLAHADNFPVDEKIPSKGITSVAMVVLNERVRSDAAKTLSFFAKQSVDIKVISGDSPLTVAAVARMVGLDVREFDARKLPNFNKSPEKFVDIITTYNVFGRVQPEQKRQIVATLQAQGHVVAMTGDGVNDALALKKADLGIAMSSGASATKAVAEVVLMDNRFSRLPRVLAEGRRVIANIERVANLFIIKNVYSLMLALGVTVLGLTYPYVPIQMTVISTLSIGVPAFLLALAPNNQLYRPGFLKRVLRFAIPVGIVSAIAMLANYYLIHRQESDIVDAGTGVSITLMIISLTVLVVLARPIRGWKIGLISLCGLAFVGTLLIPLFADLFSYDIDPSMLPATLFIGAIGAILVVLIKKLDERIGLRQ